MAVITINTTAEEQADVLRAIEKLQDKVVAVTEIAKEAGMNPNRVRYVIADLLEAGKVRREVARAFNNNYIRYKYYVVQ